jgi:hypothetical protein
MKSQKEEPEKTREPYVKPRIEIVSLVPKETVLGVTCNTASNAAHDSCAPINSLCYI